jgi:endonuclease/exonuclease/phosphatase family metal-dependent hydrolase
VLVARALGVVVGRLAALVAALVTLAACATTPPPALRVMTWNVETHAHDPAEWAPVVARLHPDVLALQEICAGEADQLAALVARDHGPTYRVVPAPIRPPTPAEAHAPVNAALGPACGTGPDDVRYGLAVLSRFPVSDPVVSTYPPDHRDEQRGSVRLGVTTASGVAVTVVDTHLGLDGVAADQVRRLAADASRAAAPAVVLGDLNLGADAPELAPLRAGFAEADPDGRHPTTAEGAIDHVYVRGLHVVGSPEAPAVTSSDHRPLVVDLQIG